MKNKHRIKFAAALATVAGIAGSTALAARPTPGLQAAQRGATSASEVEGTTRQPRFMPLAPHVLDGMRKQGRTVKHPFKTFGNNNGTKFNPGGQTVGPLQTDPVQKVLVIFVEFSNPPPGGPEERIDLKYFDDLLFGTKYDPPAYRNYPGHPTDRTLKNYFKEVSYGMVDVVTFDMPSDTGWVKLDHSYQYYWHGDGYFGAYPQNPIGAVVEALRKVDPLIDFSKYAVNGEVPNLFVVHAGSGGEWSSDPALIWSHQMWVSFYSEPELLHGFMADGVKLNMYTMLPEVGGDTTGYWVQASGPFPPTVSVFAHEWAHMLGLPDQYDYGEESDGTGMYSLMSYGGWGWSCPNVGYPEYLLFLGNSPTHLDAWSKYRLGFVNPIKVEPGAAVPAVLPPVELEPVVYRLDVPNSGGKEYFLLENRQQIGFDEGLRYSATSYDPPRLRVGGHGLAIWHIDDTVLTRNWVGYWRPNEAENWKEFRSEGWKPAWTGETHYGISLIQADDEWHLEHAAWAGGDAADLYPGLLGVTRFGDDTLPNSSSYYFWPGSEPKFGFSGVTVDNIKEVGGVITADLYFAR